MLDAHCHCHWREFENKNSSLCFCSYAINKDDWLLLANYDCKYKAFGLHPLWANESLDGLEVFLKQARALGEIGLDFREKSPSKILQIELARTWGLTPLKV